MRFYAKSAINNVMNGDILTKMFDYLREMGVLEGGEKYLVH